MIATEANIQDIMKLIRLEDDSEETFSIIRKHVGAAELYLQNTGIAPDYTNDLYVDLVAQFVGIKWDAPEGVGGAALFNPTFVGQIEQYRTAVAEMRDEP